MKNNKNKMSIVGIKNKAEKVAKQSTKKAAERAEKIEISAKQKSQSAKSAVKNKINKTTENIKSKTVRSTSNAVSKAETHKNNLVKKSNNAKNKKSSATKKIKNVFMLLFFGVLVVGACAKNSDTYLHSSYFKNNESSKLPTHTFTELSQEETTKLAKSVLPAVVAIVANNGRAESIGSGVCVKSGGYILTNQHVIENAKSVKLFFSNNDSSSAIVLWQDPIMDIAILKSKKPIPYLEMADNDLAEIGNDILAVGTPLSLNFTHTITKGIISAVNRTIKISTERGEALMQNLIQHDASINPGNSGGPLIDRSGAVIGINTLKISTAEGLGFAIPINSVQTIVENIYNNFNYKTPYIGLFGYDNSLNLAFESEDVLGFYVKDVQGNSPAKLAGLESGDVVLEVDNNEVKTTTQFRKNLFRKDARDRIKLKIKRNNRIFNTYIKPVENENFKPEAATQNDYN